MRHRCTTVLGGRASGPCATRRRAASVGRTVCRAGSGRRDRPKAPQALGVLVARSPARVRLALGVVMQTRLGPTRR